MILTKQFLFIFFLFIDLSFRMHFIHSSSPDWPCRTYLRAFKIKPWRSRSLLTHKFPFIAARSIIEAKFILPTADLKTLAMVVWFARIPYWVSFNNLFPPM